MAYNVPVYEKLRLEGAIWVSSLERERTSYTVLNDVCFSFYFLKENHFFARSISFFNVGGVQEGVRG